MRIELIKAVEQLEDTYYYEFAPGEFRGQHWSREAVYIHGDVFPLIADIFRTGVRGFDLYGPTTISGSAIGRLAEDLGDFALRLGRVERPEDIWNTHHMDEPIWEEIDDWHQAQRQLCMMLRDLGQWLLAAKARKEPVTILGL